MKKPTHNDYERNRDQKDKLDEDWYKYTRVRYKLIGYTSLWQEAESHNMVYNIPSDISEILFSHFLPLRNKALFQFCSTNVKQRLNSLADSQ